jgi:hypothetical protein
LTAITAAKFNELIISAAWRCVVADTLAFSIVDVPDSQPPQPCSLCGVKPASFEYEISTDEISFQQLTGSCCLGCAGNLLDGFEEVRRARKENTPEYANCAAN